MALLLALETRYQRHCLSLNCFYLRFEMVHYLEGMLYGLDAQNATEAGEGVGQSCHWVSASRKDSSNLKTIQRTVTDLRKRN